MTAAPPVPKSYPTRPGMPFDRSDVLTMARARDCYTYAGRELIREYVDLLANHPDPRVTLALRVGVIFGMAADDKYLARDWIKENAPTLAATFKPSTGSDPA